MDLFDFFEENEKEKSSPLAMRMRPETLDEVAGQKHLIAKDKLLYRAIVADRLSSIIFYGPSGTGKSTLASVIARTTKAEFERLNATVAGKKDVEEVVKRAKERLGGYNKRTILFLDEIHRFNKAQQDYLLPFVEDGTLILIGATTENPFFEVNRALLSRAMILELKPLSEEDIKEVLQRAINDKEKGLGNFNIDISPEAINYFARYANGDARYALNALEIAALSTKKNEEGKTVIDLNTAANSIGRKVMTYDKNDDEHYDTISAFIKSMRGSDPDASLYYLARMLESGEDIRFIARRIIIAASEDVGNADPMALTVAVSAATAVERIGMPEARIILAQAVTYIATAPKSNASYVAVDKAFELVRNTNGTIPSYLRDGHYSGAAELDRAQGYKYPHSYPNNYVKQRYMPEELADERFYRPAGNGYEKNIISHMKRIKGEQNDV